MDYKYDCSTLEYLKIESGLKEVPQDSIDTFIVIPAKDGDIGIGGDKVYKFTNNKWVEIGDFIRGEDDA